MVNVRVGMLQNPHEIEISVEHTAQEVKDIFEQAQKDNVSFIWLTDTDGKQAGIPVEKIAYIEVVSDSSKKMGF